MMTSSNGNIFRVTGPLCGEFTGPGEFPAQRPVTWNFDVFFSLHPNKRLSKPPWGWWFETPSWSLWRQCNVAAILQTFWNAFTSMSMWLLAKWLPFSRLLKCFYFSDKVWISIKISLKFVPMGSMKNMPTLFRIMAWHNISWWMDFKKLGYRNI